MTLSQRDPDDVSDDLRLAQAANVDALYERYGRRSLAFLTTLGLRGADADDVHQTAWVRVVQALAKKPFEGNFRAWLFQIMRNTAIDSYRKKRPDPLHSATAAETIGGADLPDANMIERERRQALERCLEKLSVDGRNIVRGRLQGEAYPQLASRLSMEVKRAHKIFFEAKQSLAECVQRSEVT